MKRSVFTLVDQPLGDTYRLLIEALAAGAVEATLVVRDELGLGPEAERLLRDLADQGGRRERSSSWAGTTLIDSDAALMRVRLSRGVTEILASAVSGLYEWSQPERPEDLCLLRADGSTALGTISHESDAFMELDADEYASLLSSVPGLSAILVKGSA